MSETPSKVRGGGIEIENLKLLCEGGWHEKKKLYRVANQKTDGV